LSWFLAFAGFALLVILHELGHFTAAKAVGMRVEKFSLFFPPTLFSVRRGETEYAIGSIPAGGYVRISGMNPSEDLPEEVRDRAYHAQPVWKRVVVIAAGPAVNLVLAFVLLFVFYAAVGPYETGVAAIEKHYPAVRALHVNDQILAVDGKKASFEQASKLISAHKCAQTPPKARCKATTPARLTILRDGRRMNVSVTPIYDAKAKRTRVGFQYGSIETRENLSLGAASDLTADKYWFFTKATLSLPARLVDTKKRKEISGAVGAYETTRQTILNQPADVIGILGLISLSLAIVNLFPFLPLDGGHIFWAIVEKVRRKPVPFAVMERAGVVGFMLIILIFLIGFTNDLDRLSGQGFGVR
jgi:regulator of sigma E protease